MQNELLNPELHVSDCCKSFTPIFYGTNTHFQNWIPQKNMMNSYIFVMFVDDFTKFWGWGMRRSQKHLVHMLSHLTIISSSVLYHYFTNNNNNLFFKVVLQDRQ